MADLVSGVIYAFAALFVILDPILSVPIFAGMTKGQSSREIHKQAFIAVAVAGVLMYIFLIFNTTIFEYPWPDALHLPDRRRDPVVPSGDADGTWS